MKALFPSKFVSAILLRSFLALLLGLVAEAAAQAQSGPVITANPVNVTINAGSTATFTVAASGSPTPSVQWQFSTDGGATFNNVSGGTTTTLTVPNVTAGQNGTKFRAVFKNASGGATTTSATMTVNFPPSVTTNPTSQAITSGANVSFVAAASGNPTATVQWQFSVNGGATFSNIAGATTTTLQLTAVPVTANGNQYRAVFTSALGTATTTAATLTVNQGPVITTNPVNETINAGGTATFTAAASGSPTPTVQWQFSTDGGATFNNVAGATTTTLTVPSVTTGQNGTRFRAVFTNPSGTATTTSATMTVNFAPSVTTNPTSQAITSGANVSFVAAASGNPTPTVQWQISVNGGATFSNITGATTTTLLLTAVPLTANGNQYRAVFTSALGTATTAAATLTVGSAPLFTRIVVSGTNLTLTGTNVVSGTYVLVTSTNLIAVPAQWTVVMSNTFTANTSFSVIATNQFSAGTAKKFFRYRTP